MKALTLITLPIAIFSSGMAFAQAPVVEPVPPVIEPVPAAEGTPTVDGSPPQVQTPGPGQEEAPAIVPSAPPPVPGAPGLPAEGTGPPGAASGTFAPLEQQKREMAESDDGYIIKDANLNDIFQFLAKSAGRQYFHNVKINGPDYQVTGHLNNGNPLAQMEELAFMYGLSLHMKGTTIYALTQAQLSQLPAAEFHYQLKYLRPSDMEQIKELVKPILSPGSGIVNFEPKTNTIIVIDSAHRIEQARAFLHSIDKAKGQVVVETKILRVNSEAAERVGVNWTNSLGETGTSIEIARSLNSVFGIDSLLDSDGQTGGSAMGTAETSTNNLVLSPIQLNGVLRALSEGNLAKQVSNPTLITEDNELASISIIDRIPIITATITQTDAGNTITEEVRYKVDTGDKTIADDPEKHREIGISLVVTPTLLPDGTIRMRMRPRSAQIVDQVRGQTGNLYPRVTESMVESIARVPDGHSLVVGGFYGESQSRDRTKIPLLGDLPVINFFFKSKETSKEQASLVFIVTPKSYNPSNKASNSKIGSNIRTNTSLELDHDWVDPSNPGPAHEPNLKRSTRGLQPEQAPYYPRAEELNYAPTNPTPKKKKVPIGRP